MTTPAPVALITGAARRVGRAIALALADVGYNIGVHYHTSRAGADELVAAIRTRGREAIALPGDLANPDATAQLVAQTVGVLRRLDVLVNNASIFEADPDGAFDAAHWARTFQINAIAPAALIDAASSHLSKHPGGCVVNLCDIAAERPWKRYQAYCASKAALVNLTKCCAKQLAPHVRVNGVSPGIAVFPEHYDDATRARLIAKVPLQRAGTPADIAATVRFLVTAGSYLTGQIIHVDGGRSIV
jgi:pteridine reductase